MKETTLSNAEPAMEERIPLSNADPDSIYSTLPTLDQYDSLDANHAFDNEGLDAFPGAFDAYLDHHQRQWL